MLPTLVRVAHRRRRLLIGVWLAALAVAAVLAAPLADKLSAGGWEVDGSQTQRVRDVERQGFTGRGLTTVTAVIHDARHTRDDPAFAARVKRVLDDLPQESDLQVTSRYGWSTLPARHGTPSSVPTAEPSSNSLGSTSTTGRPGGSCRTYSGGSATATPPTTWTCRWLASPRSGERSTPSVPKGLPTPS